MPICSSCGATNREDARFCYQCATPIAREHPSPADQAWLAATLTARLASPSEAPIQPQRSISTPRAEAPSTEEQGAPMDQTQPPTMEQPTPLFAERYEIVARQGEQVEASERQPWQRCWACGATSNEAGELFCTECGANLDGRRYHGQLREGEPTGLALVPVITDPAMRDTLPPIWDQAQHEDQTLTLIAVSGRAPVAPPLEEIQALYIGRGLAHLLNQLHAEGLALGKIAVDDVELTAAEIPRLRTTPGLQRIAERDSKAHAADLRALAGLLESLTATPRTTRRLNE